MSHATIVHESGNTAAENAQLEHRAASKAAMHAWVSSLASWELVFHGTWKWEASCASAQRGFERWMRREAPDVSYFYALERNPSRDGFHVHSIWANTAGMYRKTLWERWFERFGRNKLEPIRSRIQVEEYLTKYVTKEVTWEERGWWNVHLVPMLKLEDRAPKRRSKGRPGRDQAEPAGDTRREYASEFERQLTEEAAWARQRA